MKCLNLTMVVTLSMLLAACAGSTANSAADDELAQNMRGVQPREQTITGVHERNRPEIRECFERAAEVTPEHAHAVEVELRIPRSGTPVSIRLLDAEEVPEEMRVCLEQALAELNYGEAESGGTYYQWLTYEAKDDALVFSSPQDAYQRWGLTREEIVAVVGDREAQIDTCYEEASDPGAGRVLLTLAIDSDGEVARAGIKKSSLESQPVEDCLVQTVLEMQFPQPRGGGVVVFDLPLRFRPVAGWIND